ncbi:MAG TPA: septum formation initiator family protein [Candidatus Ventrimonas merdavium]|nr:septum formation initiator family protein [Candidatus Ventrimonas merdavium]
MSVRGKTRRKRRDRWGNRLAIIGITMVVASLAVVVNVKSTSMKKKDQEYQIREEALMKQKEEEENRANELEEYRVYVQTKQYIEEIAKQKLGLVKPDEILLKPAPKE